MTESIDMPVGSTGREREEVLRDVASQLEHLGLFRVIVDAMPDPVSVLSRTRQVVVANQALLDLLETTEDRIRGKRPGEIVQCMHADEGPDGCGTGSHCQFCGALQAILQCQGTKCRTSNECRLTVRTRNGLKSMDLHISASPFFLSSQEFAVVVFKDIEKQKRLDVLTRTFFHDVLNTAGGIRGFAQLLEEDLPPGTSEQDDARQLGSLAEKLIDEIECQRDLTRAENGELTVTPKPVRASELLMELRTLYSAHEVSTGREIVLGPCWDGSLLVDPRLLVRVLSNMIKNAVEATPVGGRIEIRSEEQGRQVVFHVSNPGVMAEHVRLQIFQRSFSTKGEAGRGIGTYSIKLFGETYLGGQVSFVSEEPDGTVFSLALPKVRLDSLAGDG